MAEQKIGNPIDTEALVIFMEALGHSIVNLRI